MRIRTLSLAIYLFFNTQCGTIHIEPKPYEERIYSPIVDKKGEKHNYKTTQSFELGNDYILYCISHHKWETISVRYTPTQLAKLRYEEYIVRVAHKQ
jgi:hypothetical protein